MTCGTGGAFCTLEGLTMPATTSPLPNKKPLTNSSANSSACCLVKVLGARAAVVCSCFSAATKSIELDVTGWGAEEGA